MVVELLHCASFEGSCHIEAEIAQRREEQCGCDSLREERML